MKSGATMRADKDRMEADMPRKNGGSGPRCVAMVGPYGAGKTTLLESILWSTGAIQRKGSVPAKNTVGDASPEARNRQMSVETNAATTRYLDESFTFLDCPGSIEFLQEALNVLPGVDAVIVVCEPDAHKAAMLQPYLKRLSDLGIPHALFVNKIDKATNSLREVLAILQEVSPKPLVLRQIPIWENGIVTGFVDLALERAYVYREHAQSELIDMSDEVKARETEARFQMLEKLADYDEHLMEELLSDVVPPRDEIFDGLQRDLQEGLIVPVLFGSALNDNGIPRLLKMLRHEAPDVSACVKRLGLTASNDTVVQILKTYHTMHGGKLSLGRVLCGHVKDGATLFRKGGDDTRIGGMFALKGQEQIKVNDAGPGDTVALGRLDEVATGETLTGTKAGARPKVKAETLTPVYGLAVSAADRKDEVKLSTAMAKLREEDPSLYFEQDPALHQMTLLGQGEMHLRVAVDRLASKYGLKLQSNRPQVPYKETIKRTTTQRGRHKRQTGGHGQFGDVVIEIKPLPRGSGFVFEDRISGGVVPRNFIPSVEKGIIDYLKEGPLGFPVVDLAVALIDGSYHAVDSSDAAFQTAARIGMTEGMPNCTPVLLEPIMHVKIHVPSDSTASVNGVISTRRGKILGFDAREGWRGWDTVEAEIPQSELHDLIVELRSLTQGVGTFEQAFHHLAELTGKLAENVVAEQKKSAA
jgi:elongation factor G